MNLNVTKEAANWYIDEMDLAKGDYVQFFVKLYGGIPTIFPSYFLGVSEGMDGTIAIQDEVQGITFYINNKDKWLLDEHDLTIDLKEDEPEFTFEKR
ncbi:Uncharacterized protein YneR [Salinibacillus kushneri]|uniref:Uncharacterized protein YneR n=1 Tax=Salinibacillus kushneri TaxID=237682 RepID=A0A1I0AQD7_9BACI|nr:hypothetical protein [Salinibacillus kushneri]SES96129.1 Uncharacterized protein YneR [Salinibacillus kushneri]